MVGSLFLDHVPVLVEEREMWKREAKEEREEPKERKERKWEKRWEPHNTNPTTLVQRQHRHRAAAVAPAWQSAVQSSLAVSSDGCSPKPKSPIGPPNSPLLTLFSFSFLEHHVFCFSDIRCVLLLCVELSKKRSICNWMQGANKWVELQLERERVVHFSAFQQCVCVCLCVLCVFGLHANIPNAFLWVCPEKLLGSRTVSFGLLLLQSGEYPLLPLPTDVP